MNCPYPDCTRRGLQGNEKRCPQCHRFLTACSHCRELNRAFANHCRKCGQELSRTGFDWQGFKGGPERTGFNPFDRAEGTRDLEEVLHLELDDRCKSLLSCDEHLIAVSANGRIEIIDAATRQRKAGLKTEGPITCEPCVHRGSLYLGSRNRLAAYTLGAITSATGSREPRWEVPISGTPVQALLAIADRLYTTVGYRDGRPQEIQALDGIGGAQPSRPRALITGHRLSAPAGGTEPRRRIVFLSEDSGRLTLNRIDHGDGVNPEVTTLPVPGAPRELKSFVPIAVLRNKVLAVFGDDSKLCAFDAERGAFKTMIQEDVRELALNGPTDGVLLQGGAIFFLYRNRPERLTPDDRISVPPVILGRRSVYVGMKDGRVRWYDLNNPAVMGEEHLAQRSEEVTALISFANYVAAGGSRGTVRLFRLEGNE